MALDGTRDEICRAIGKCSVIKFSYKGKQRVVEPYLCGLSNANKYVLLGFQTGGHSSTNKFGWKLFELLNISHLEITETEFNVSGAERLRYDPVDRRIKKTFCAIPKP
ncbi:MAG TPA: hypothetical protein VGO50_00895 [Pyrinomonadaceae bacterium]|jgi:hypothetical protein|nr:hypothetical protein [Pyrinomonadaceae bacterium]